MNRTIALFLAVAILLAHTLAIHQGSFGSLAPPYEQAHVAYRLGYNWVHDGAAVWDPSLASTESYPSLLWVGLCALIERAYLSVTRVTQGFGVVCAMMSVWVLARFSPKRLAGVTAPLLFVVSGGVAAAAANGMETSFFALIVISSFLAYERRWPRTLAVLLSIACVTRSEGALFALALLLVEASGWVRGTAQQRARRVWTSFGVTAVVLVALGFIRENATGNMLSPWTAALLQVDPEKWSRGLQQLADFARCSGWTLLLIYPVWYGLRGFLTGLGRRALLLAVAWASVSVATGGSSLPFFESMVPVFALVIIAIQESLILALDSKKRGWPALTWTLFIGALVLSAFVSKYPGDLGPIPTERIQRSWMEPRAEAAFGRRQMNGRLGLTEELMITRRMRSLGIFLRAQLDPSTRVLTPYPGALGYISRLPVIDLLGRTTAPPGAKHSLPWSGVPRTDVVRMLELEADYIVPSVLRSERAPTAHEIADEWVTGIDIHREQEDRVIRVRDMLRRYELITVPIPIQNSARAQVPRNNFHLLRRRALAASPKLSLSIEGQRFRVDVAHDSHEQIVDLRVQLETTDGVLWSLLPTGQFKRTPRSLARTSILLFPTGERQIELTSGTLPEGLRLRELRAVLRNPGARAEHVFAFASASVTIPLR